MTIRRLLGACRDWLLLSPLGWEVEHDAIDVHTFRGQERLAKWATLNDQERYSAMVRGSVRTWQAKRRRRVA